MDFIIDFFVENFQNCIWLAVLLVAMCPALESKIAIPLAMNVSIWGNNALHPLTAFLLSFFGSIIPSLIIIFVMRKIKSKTTGFVSSKFFHKYQIKGSSIEQKSSNIKKYLAFAGFVAVPIPLTGVWTGSLIAGLSNLDIKYCFLSIMLGGLLSSGAVTLICTIFTNSVSYLFMISLLIVIIFLLIELIYSLIKERKSKNMT